MTARILVVEDDYILATGLASQLEQAGFTVVGPALDVDTALSLVQTSGCDAAILDVQLGPRTTSAAVAVELKRRLIPFLSVTGFTSEQRPAAFDGAPLLMKPMKVLAMLTELRRCLGVQ